MKTLMTKLSVYFLLTSIAFAAGCGGQSSSSSSSSGGGGNSTSGSSTSTSQSGSTAAMLTYEHALYILDSFGLRIYDTSSPEQTTEVNSHRVAGAETLFVYEKYLYIGSNTGVDIWNLDDPLYPIRVNFYPHVRGCDPVIVSNNIGYVTLRNRTGCRGNANSLELIDFTDPTQPVPITLFRMQNPYGLAKTEEYLAVCQENFGLSLLDISFGEEDGKKTGAVQEVAKFLKINCFDLIYSNNVLLATASDGIYQFGVDGFILTALSKIPVGEVEGKVSTQL